MMTVMTRFAVLALSAAAAFGQSRPEFDVASLKPVMLDGHDTYTANLGTFKNGTLTMTNVTLAECLKWAYGITNDDQIAGPEWIKNKGVRFDVLAKASPSVPKEQAMLMLQALLDQRFQIAMHHEDRTLSYVALTVGKDGPKLKRAEEPPRDSPTQRFNHIVHHHMDMPLLASLLSRFNRTRITDMTGIKGYYDIDLEWSPEPPPGAEPAPGDPLNTAIQKQLGLKLETRKGPLDCLVIDRATETPLAN